MFSKACGTIAAVLVLGCGSALAADITVATVNNNQMIVMQRLSSQWEKQTGNHINWVVLEENVLRQRVTTDIATNGGQFDVITIGSYETPIWGKQNWLVRSSDFPASYDYNDIFQSVRASALHRRQALCGAVLCGKLVHLCTAGTCLIRPGLKMPDQPKYCGYRGLRRRS